MGFWQDIDHYISKFDRWVRVNLLGSSIIQQTKKQQIKQAPKRKPIQVTTADMNVNNEPELRINSKYGSNTLNHGQQQAQGAITGMKGGKASQIAETELYAHGIDQIRNPKKKRGE